MANLADSTNVDPTIVVGGGFVGLFTALHLHRLHYEAPVVVIDPHDRFVFKPLLYEYVSGEMRTEQVFPSYRQLLTERGITFVQGTVTGIDFEQRQVFLATGEQYHYRYLVLGVGSQQGYFGTEGAAEHGLAFRTEADALHLRHHLEDCLKRASQLPDGPEKDALLTFAVVGAGPSGVEMAAMLADLLPLWWCRYFNSTVAKTDGLRVVLINHGSEILAGDANEGLRQPVLKELQKRHMPVELKLGVGVKAVAADHIAYQVPGQDSVELLATATTIWTAGTANNSLLEQLPLPTDQRDKHGRPLVTPTLQLVGHPEVFAAGDCALNPADPQPPLAQVAYQQGTTIADNLVALQRDKPLTPVHVGLRGTLMKLGLGNGIANLFNKVQIKGKPGSLMRDATYLSLLPAPGHDLKMINEWLADEFVGQYHSPWLDAPGLHSNSSMHATTTRAIDKALGMAIAAVFLLMGGLLLWQMLTYQRPEPSPQSEVVIRRNG
ncbi:MAG: NAD(P)/FAD-dependent oxidoreductase [Leptolyngbya sp. LCM1.Bin17]|nr:MAG: NAD(P)/FAD-dependent oxidoreductase [Leptolyngbya sp. LCM1.Bin17]